jgi:hypothetical protein
MVLEREKPSNREATDNRAESGRAKGRGERSWDSLEQALVARVMDDIRRGEPLDDATAKQANSYPLIGVMRQLVRSEDVPEILALTDSDHESVRGLGLSLLKTVENRPEIRSFLEQLWRKRTDLSARQNIM